MVNVVAKEIFSQYAECYGAAAALDQVIIIAKYLYLNFSSMSPNISKLLVLWRAMSRSRLATLASPSGRNYDVRLRLSRDAVYEGGLERGPRPQADPLQRELEVRLLHLGPLTPVLVLVAF